jgi:hypothetical protein
VITFEAAYCVQWETKPLPGQPPLLTPRWLYVECQPLHYCCWRTRQDIEGKFRASCSVRSAYCIMSSCGWKANGDMLHTVARTKKTVLTSGMSEPGVVLDFHDGTSLDSSSQDEGADTGVLDNLLEKPAGSLLEAVGVSGRRA